MSTARAASLRGDANADGVRDTLDVFFLINNLQAGGSAPARVCLADADSNGSLNMADVSYLAAYLLDEGAAPAPQPAEVCNGADDDCDGVIDNGVTQTFFHDADADGYGSLADSTQGCTAPPGYTVDSTDCDDSNPSIHPGATDVCANGIDENCDGSDPQAVTHINCIGTGCGPLGQSFATCSGLGNPGVDATYSSALAQAAAAAWNVTATGTFQSTCGGPGSANAIAKQTASACAVWTFASRGTAVSGHVYFNAISNTCLCPLGTDHTWN